jgi:uncharacterized protein YkwD
MNGQRWFLLTFIGLGIVSFASQAEAQLLRHRNAPRYYYYPAQHQVVYSQPQPAANQPAEQAVATDQDAQQVAQASANLDTAQAQAGSGLPTAIWNMLARNNALRTTRGMRPMSLSSRLTAAAQNHANYMARTGVFDHYSNGGPQGRVAMYGFRGGVRENIAMGQPSVDSAFQTWTASGAHYANMMSHSDVAGFGYAVGANGQAYWVAVYGNNDGGN